MSDDLDLIPIDELLAELGIEASAQEDPGPENYNEEEENRKRQLMQEMAFYAEEGPTFDPQGKYLCGSCYYRQVMDWGDEPYCYIMEGKISLETGSCQFYKYGTPDSEWNPLRMGGKYEKKEANYAERPRAKGFGCFPRCEYGAVAEGQDSRGREIWCKQFGVHVRPKACCAFEDGKDLVQIESSGEEIEAGGPGSGCNPDVGKCGRPEGPEKDHTFYMHEKIGDAQGSNPGGMYKGKDGIYRYVKLYSDPKQARGEFLANNIYRALGKNAPESVLFKKDGKDTIASKQLEGKTFQQMGKFDKEQAQAVMNGFAADVLTANWDTVGTGHDNILVSPNGGIYRIDQGGTFLKRAKGGDKPEDVLNQITEVKQFLNPAKNMYYSTVAKVAGVSSVSDLGDKTDTTSFKEQVEMITALRDQVGGWQKYVADTVPEMPKPEQQKIAGMLEARTNLLENAVHQQEQPKMPSDAQNQKALDQLNKDKTSGEWNQEDDTKKESKWRQYNPNNIGGYFRPNTAIATIYQSLVAKEGQWQSVAEIKKSLEGKSTANLDARFQQLKYVGNRSGRWTMEISGDNARIFLAKAGDKKVVEVSDDKQAIIKQAVSGIVGKYNVTNNDKDNALATVYKQLGVPYNSQTALYEAVKGWTGSVDTPVAQNWRQVAMEHYNREPSGDYVEYGKIIGTPKSIQKAEAMKEAAMVLKAFSGEYARQNHVDVVYRNIGGDQAKDVIKAMRGAVAAGKTKIQVSLNSLSSWSDKKDLSLGGSIKLRMKIDPDNVWAIHEASPNLFSAHKHEREYVVGIHSPKETFSLDDISVSGGYYDDIKLSPDEQKMFKKVFAEKEKEEEDDVYRDFVVGPLDDDWLHKDDEEEK